MLPLAIVSIDEKTHDAGSPTMSAETSGSSQYSSTPRYDASAAALRTPWLIVVDRRRRSRASPTGR